MTSPRILVCDGSPAEATAINRRFGGRPYAEVYPEALRQQMPGLDIFVLSVAEGERLPQGMTLTDFDGVAWTGSPLSAYEDIPAVTGQIELARQVFEAGVPCFGSCWGLQIMAAALGGEVKANPKGYEIGIARNIAVTDAGRGHAMFRSKDAAFDAIAVHRDEVTRLPDGATVLATNSMSVVQAAEIRRGAKSFWGVQYHPEFDLALIAAIMQKLAGRMVADGLSSCEDDLGRVVADFRALDAAPGRTDLIWRHGLGAGVIDPFVRRAELRNWLEADVADRARVRAAAAV